jgi:hypothetical protein
MALMLWPNGLHDDDSVSGSSFCSAQASPRCAAGPAQWGCIKRFASSTGKASVLQAALANGRAPESRLLGLLLCQAAVFNNNCRNLNHGMVTRLMY